MCSKNWCGYCKTDTEKKDYTISRARSHVAHVCKCCNLTTSVTEKNVTYNIVVEDSHEQA